MFEVGKEYLFDSKRVKEESGVQIYIGKQYVLQLPGTDGKKQEVTIEVIDWVTLRCLAVKDVEDQ